MREVAQGADLNSNSLLGFCVHVGKAKINVCSFVVHLIMTSMTTYNVRVRRKK